MDFELNDTQKSYQNQFRKFAEEDVKPLAHEIDEQERFPQETIEKMGKLGWMGLPFAKDLGGQGCDTLTYILCIEEISKVCASTGVILSSHTSLCADAITKSVNPEQLEKYLIPLAQGKMLGAFALTERNAGTDVSGIQTTAVLKDDHYVINGQKIFITNGGRADIYVVFALTDPGQGSRGLSAFIVEKGCQGFRVGHVYKKMGIRASITSEIIFEDCIVPKENLLGGENRGYEIAMRTLDGGRIGIAAQSLGIAEGAFNEAIDYVKNRIQFGRPISEFQNTQFVLAGLKAKTEAAKLLVYRAAMAKDSGNNFSQEAAIAKLFASETAMDVTTKCVQLYGGNGYLRDFPMERMMRDAKITEIYEGTNEVQRMVIASKVLKR